MIERGIRPGIDVVALVAGLGKGRSHVIWISRRLIILQMAGDASRAREVEIVVDVAIRALAWGNSVSAGQRKSDRGVIEIRTQPVIGAMAGFAGGGKPGADVIRIARRLEVGRVAGITGGRHRLELAVGRALVAGIAVHSRVRSGQREAVVMLLDLLD